MVQTITPVVHGGRRGRWAGAVALHTVGAAASAAVLGAALGSIGAVLGAPWGRPGFVAVAGIALLYAGRELVGLPVPLPNLRRQVPEWWRTFFSQPVSAFLYGLGLGVGFFTYLSFGTLVAVGAAAIVSGSPIAGLVVTVPFGVARGLSVVAARKAESAEGVSRTIARLDALAMSHGPRMINGVALTIVAAAAILAAGEVTVDGSSSVAPWVLAALFGWAALAKILRPAAWRESLDGYALGPLRSIALAVVPAAEAAVTNLVVTGIPRAAGSLGLGLVAVFSLAVLRARRLAGDRVPCGCFGRTRARDYRLLLARNGAIAALALATIAAPGVTDLHIHAPSASESVPVALAATGALLAFLLVRASTRIRARYRA